MKFKSAVTIAVVFIFARGGYGSPSFIEKCSRKDPNLNDCILRNAKKAVPEIMKGNAALQIPDLNAYDPLDQTLTVGGITYTVKNIKHKSGDLTPIYTSMDIPSHSAVIGMQLPFLVWKGDFSAKGQYKGKDIDATGRVTINYDGIQFNYTKNFEDKEIAGKVHLQITSDSTVGDIEKISIVHNYDDTAVGKDELDTLVPEIKSALKNQLKGICSQLVTYVMNAILGVIPKNEIFLP